MPEKAAIARKIKKFRRLHNLSQWKFAEQCGISVEALSLLECEKGNPTLDTLQGLAAYMDLSAAELVDMED